MIEDFSKEWYSLFNKAEKISNRVVSKVFRTHKVLYKFVGSEVFSNKNTLPEYFRRYKDHGYRDAAESHYKAMVASLIHDCYTGTWSENSPRSAEWLKKMSIKERLRDKIKWLIYGSHTIKPLDTKITRKLVHETLNVCLPIVLSNPPNCYSANSAGAENAPPNTSMSGEKAEEKP